MTMVVEEMSCAKCAACGMMVMTPGVPVTRRMPSPPARPSLTTSIDSTRTSLAPTALTCSRKVSSPSASSSGRTRSMSIRLPPTDELPTGREVSCTMKRILALWQRQERPTCAKACGPPISSLSLVTGPQRTSPGPSTVSSTRGGRGSGRPVQAAAAARRSRSLRMAAV